jgi:hypothetical protein
MTNTEQETFAATFEATALADQLRPLLAGRSPEVAGAVLAQLLAHFIAGHIPPMREQATALVVDGAKALVPVIVDELVEVGRLPAEWRQ